MRAASSWTNAAAEEALNMPLVPQVQTAGHSKRPLAPKPRPIAEKSVRRGGSSSSSDYYSTQKTSGNTPLHDAARNGWMGVVEAFLAAGDPVDPVNEPWRETPLHVAVKHQQVEVAKCLVEHGAMVNSKTSDSWSPLHFAVDVNCKELVQLLVAKGANLDSRTHTNRRPLDLAMSARRMDLAALVKPLNKRKGDAELTSNSSKAGQPEWMDYLDDSAPWWTLTHTAARDNDVALVRSLVEAEKWDSTNKPESGRGEPSGAVINFTPSTIAADVKEGLGETGITPLHIAVLRCHEEIVRCLVESKFCPVDCCDIHGRTPLHVAVDNANPTPRRVAVAKYLLEQGACPFRLCLICRNAVNYAARWRMTPMLDSILSFPKDTLREKFNLMPHSPLHSACESGDPEVVGLFLDLNMMDPNVATNKFNKTPLYVATTSGQVAICKRLLAAGANPNLCNRDGWGPVHLWCRIATSEGQGLLDLLLDSGGDLTQPTVDGWCPFHIACQTGSKETIRTLIRRGVDVNVATGSRWTAMHVAVHRGEVEVMKLLLDEGADPNILTAEGWSPLHIAAQNQLTESVKFLLDTKRVSAKAGNNQGWTPLHMAAQKGDLEIMRLLLLDLREGDEEDLPQALEAVNVGGWNALHIAAHHGHSEQVQTLLDYGAFVDPLTPDKGWTPLHLSVDQGKLDTVQILVQNGSKIDQVDRHGRTLVHTAVQRGHDKVLECLMDLGLEMNWADSDGWTPLHCAVATGFSACLRLLLKRASPGDVEASTSHHRTPLAIATAKGHADCVRMLLTAGAMVRPETVTTATGGWLPIHSAADRGFADVTEVLLHHDPMSAHAGTTQKKLPLHLACGFGTAIIVSLHLKAGVSVDARCGFGWTGLHYAAQMNKVEVCRMLLEAGARVDIRNAGSWTALHIAASKGFGDIVGLILGCNRREELVAAINMTTNKKYTALDLAKLRPEHHAIRQQLRDAGVREFQVFARDPDAPNFGDPSSEPVGRILEAQQAKEVRKKVRMWDRVFTNFDVQILPPHLGRRASSVTPVWFVAEWLHIRFGTVEGLHTDKLSQLERNQQWMHFVEAVTKQAKYKTSKNLSELTAINRMQRGFNQWLAVLQSEVFGLLRDQTVQLGGCLIFSLESDARGLCQGNLFWRCAWTGQEEPLASSGTPMSPKPPDQAFKRLVLRAVDAINALREDEEASIASDLMMGLSIGKS